MPVLQALWRFRLELRRVVRVATSRCLWVLAMLVPAEQLRLQRVRPAQTALQVAALLLVRAKDQALRVEQGVRFLSVVVPGLVVMVAR